MRRFFALVSVALFALLAFVAGYLVSRMTNPDLPYAAPKYALDGSVAVPEFRLPPSSYMSEESANMLKLRAAMPMPDLDPDQDINETRTALDKLMSSTVSAMRERYPVTIEESAIAGVPVRIFSPADAEPDPGRVLINLHGGAFSVCWDACSILESAPVSALGNFKVVSVNYRMAPEAKHPAGAEDVLAVYRELSREYDSKQIGIYGCSAGGVLTAQAAAMLTTQGMEMPGAIGIFGAGAVPFGSGDSGYVAAYIDGSFPPPPREGEERADITRGYFAGVDLQGPLVSPGMHPDLMANFPPTLITTGTRATDLSPAVYTNSQLIKAGVESTLIVAEGMGHCYQYFPAFPEARDAHATTVDFFKSHLGQAAGGRMAGR